MMRCDWAFEKMQRLCPRGKLLNIGGAHENYAVFKPYDMLIVDNRPRPTPLNAMPWILYYSARYEYWDLDNEYFEGFDAIWCAHTLEHCLEPHLMLKRMFLHLKPGGVLAITVPPMKPEIVGGHVNLYNAGLLLYRLVLAGFDCHLASVKTEGYNIAVVVVKTPIKAWPVLEYDHGDVKKLRTYFPQGLQIDGDSFNGNIQTCNWE